MFIVDEGAEVQANGTENLLSEVTTNSPHPGKDMASRYRRESEPQTGTG